MVRGPATMPLVNRHWGTWAQGADTGPIAIGLNCHANRFRGGGIALVGDPGRAFRRDVLQRSVLNILIGSSKDGKNKYLISGKKIGPV